MHHALTGWTQADNSGVALLEQDKDSNRFVSVCGTTGLASADILSSSDMSDSEARTLSAEFVAMIQAEPVDWQAQLDSFGETDHMGTHHQPYPPH